MFKSQLVSVKKKWSLRAKVTTFGSFINGVYCKIKYCVPFLCARVWFCVFVVNCVSSLWFGNVLVMLMFKTLDFEAIML